MIHPMYLNKEVEPRESISSNQIYCIVPWDTWITEIHQDISSTKSFLTTALLKTIKKQCFDAS